MTTPDLPRWLRGLLASAVLALAACAAPTERAAQAESASSPVDAWLGHWSGPEGTRLSLARADAAYQVTVRDLDGPRSFRGRRVGETIEFERDGRIERIRATRGADTGMKWLQGKSNCLTVRTGEGYCRD